MWRFVRTLASMAPQSLPAGSESTAARYHHVDVFSEVGYAGNSLAVFVDPPSLTGGQMSLITRELRHFETIFVTTTATAGVVRARVFDLADELEFAGHPVLGAAGVLHESDSAVAGEERWWTFLLSARDVRVRTRRDPAGHVSALLDQGRPDVVGRLSRSDGSAIASALGLDETDLHDQLPPEVISTGLRYLVVPVRGGDAIARARIAHPDFTAFLSALGAQFVYVLDAAAVEGRHWNNDGLLEDVATGSAAGCVAAYLMRHGLARHGEELSLSQGRFVGRPSRLAITAYGTAEDVERVTVGGDVVVVGTGELRLLPPQAGA